MEDSEFQRVVDRLVAACSFPNEQALAEELGFKRTTFVTRKSRNALPRAEIDALVAARGLNPEWVYEGRGAMFTGPGFAQKVRLQAAINERLDLFALNGRQHRFMAKLLMAVELTDPLWLKELLDSSNHLSGEEEALIKGLRSAPPELLAAVTQLAKLADKLRERKQGETGAAAAPKPSAIPDSETARMKPAEKRRYEAVRKGRAAK